MPMLQWPGLNLGAFAFPAAITAIWAIHCDIGDDQDGTYGGDILGVMNVNLGGLKDGQVIVEMQGGIYDIGRL